MSAKEDKAVSEDEIKVSLALSLMKNRLLVFSGKGGVGKSTVAANLALALAQKGMKIGLLDIDIHGPNLPKMLGVEDKRLDVSPVGIKPVEVKKNLKLVSMSFLLQDPNLPVIWRGPMKMKAIQQFLGDVKWGELDWLVIATPQEVSLMDSRKAVAFARRLNLNILGIIENMSGMVCPHCGKRIDLFKVGGGQRSAQELGVPFLGKIPLDPQIVILGDEGKAFIDAQPQSEASQAFMRVVDNIIKNNAASS